MAERGLVNVEIVEKGLGAFTDQVQIKTSNGAFVWVPERDVIARKPDPEAQVNG
jgi:hypothetical protein